MATETEICVVALSNIGAKTIADMTEASEEARQCRIHLPLARDTLLQSYPWLFARRMQSLAAVASVWEERWEYTYVRPSDCLKPIRIVPVVDIASDTRDIGYGVSEGHIFANESPAKLEYTARLTDISRFPPLVQDALIWSLSARLAMSLTRDQSIRKDSYQIAAQAIEAAKVADANEEQASYDFPSTFIEARN